MFLKVCLQEKESIVIDNETLKNSFIQSCLGSDIFNWNKSCFLNVLPECLELFPYGKGTVAHRNLQVFKYY